MTGRASGGRGRAAPGPFSSSKKDINSTATESRRREVDGRTLFGGMTEELAPQPAPADQKRGGRRLWVQGVEGTLWTGRGTSSPIDRASRLRAGGEARWKNQTDRSSPLPEDKDLGLLVGYFFCYVVFFRWWDGWNQSRGEEVKTPPFLREVLLGEEDRWWMRKGGRYVL